MKLHLLENQNNSIEIAIDFLLNQLKANNLAILNYIIILPTTFACKIFKETFAQKNNNSSLFLPKVYTKQNLLDFFISQLSINNSKELELILLTELILTKYNAIFNSNIENIIQLSHNIIAIIQKKKIFKYR